MNVLLTGGAGFIGSHVAESLVKRGDTVTVLDSFDTFYDPAIKRRTAESVIWSGSEKNMCTRTSVGTSCARTTANGSRLPTINGSRRPQRERIRSLANPIAGSATASPSKAISFAVPAIVPDMPQTAVR